MDKNSDVIMGIVVTALFLAIFVGLIYVGLKLLGRLFGFHRRKDLKTKASPEQPKTRTWLLVLAIAMMLMMANLGSPLINNIRVKPWPEFSIWTLWLPTLLLVGLFIWMMLRDPISFRAKRRSDAGDIDGAIEILREAIEGGKITAVRANNLGILYMSKKEPQQALKMFRDAAKLGADAPVYVSNQALALLDLNQFEDAAAIIHDVCQKNPQQWLFACNYARVLISLGRLDEAQAQIERAENLPIPGGNQSDEAERARFIQEHRDLLAGKPASMKPMGFDEI